jgi:tRNA (mo5U34)-methyltransferase
MIMTYNRPPMTDVAEEVAAHGWYHSIELPGGIVTPGRFDTRKAARKIPLPASLAGKRCLDVGTADGFWAFEMERRGAAEVVAIDLIDPSKRDLTRKAHQRSTAEGDVSRQTETFALARRLLDSKVEWRNLSVYDLSPDEVGTFDFVFMGSLLVHLRDPVLALQAVRSVVGGELMNYEAVTLGKSLLYPRTPVATLNGLARADWYIPNKACLRRWIRAAAFDIVSAGGIVFIELGRKTYRLRMLRHPIENAPTVFAGMPHSWVISRPGKVRGE